MKKLIFLFITAFLCCSAFAQHSAQIKHHVSFKETTPACSNCRYGIASYYAKKFNGRRTANGEIFSTEKYTAACNVLRLGTWIKVTNLRNKKSVIVKVNDRLHPKNKRLVDLSPVAAKALGYHGRGLTKVKVEVLPHYHS